MQSDGERYVRWEPLPLLPECPLGDVAVTFDGRLQAVATYSFGSNGETLHIDFGDVEAFKVYEEFSVPPWDEGGTRPMVKNAALHKWVWPLLEVENSKWIARTLARNGGLEPYGWRHFEIITGTYCLHVMTNDAPREVRLLSRQQ